MQGWCRDLGDSYILDQLGTDRWNPDWEHEETGMNVKAGVNKMGAAKVLIPQDARQLVLW